MGALFGAASVLAAALPLAGPYLAGVGVAQAALLVVGGGFAAAMLDSALGASVQARYREPSGALTERAVWAGPDGPVALPLARGWRWVDNDRVNLLCTLTGGLCPVAALALT